LRGFSARTIVPGTGVRLMVTRASRTQEIKTSEKASFA
jgi:hypothetical protein